MSEQDAPHTDDVVMMDVNATATAEPSSRRRPQWVLLTVAVVGLGGAVAIVSNADASTKAAVAGLLPTEVADQLGLSADFGPSCSMSKGCSTGSGCGTEMLVTAASTETGCPMMASNASLLAESGPSCCQVKAATAVAQTEDEPADAAAAVQAARDVMAAENKAANRETL